MMRPCSPTGFSRRVPGAYILHATHSDIPLMLMSYVGALEVLDLHSPVRRA